MRVVVLGGAGLLGRALVSTLLARGVDVVGAGRRSGVDLENGSGLAEVLVGADVVVHAATDRLHPRRVDLVGTRRVVAAVRAARASTHVVYVSVVGCDASPDPYQRAKTACEHELEEAGLPATVVRATPFHPLVAGLARAARPLGVGLAVRGVAVQSSDVGWVARRVADVATALPPAGFVRAADLAGPDRLSAPELLRLVAAHDGVRLRRVVTLPAVGGVARALAAGANLPGPGAEAGGPSLASWLVSGR